MKKKFIKEKNFLSKKTKRKTKTDGPNPRTNGESKGIQTKSHPEAYTHTLTKKGQRGKIKISCSQSPPPEFGMICCLFRYSTDTGTSRCLWSVKPLLLRLLGEISLFLLCSYSSLGSALDLDLPVHVGHLRASVRCSHRMGLKEQLLQGLWLTQAGRREGYGGGGLILRRQRPARRCSTLMRAVRSPGEAVPGSRDAGSGRLHRLQGGAVWLVTCARTQASWWWEQQP